MFKNPAKIALLYLCCLSPGLGLDKVSLDDRNWLFTATDQTVPLVTTRYVAWEANWKWAGPSIRRENSRATLAYKGSSKVLDTDFTAIADIKKNQILWEYHWDKKADHPTAYGLGIEFVLKLNSPTFTTKAEVPELLPENKGWRWQTPNGQMIEVTFAPALAKIYYEGNQKDKIRAMFFGHFEKGKQQSTMTVKVSDKVKVTGMLSSLYGDSDRKTWHRDILSERASPIDLSFLNQDDKPAGKHGKVRVKADQLVFEDGTPTKFWGANVMAYALFASSDIDIKTHAKRLAQLGFNLARIHHHDSPWVKGHIFKNQKINTLELSQDAFKKLDWWIKCLKEEGIYVWLDLHVGRALTKADGIDHFADMAKGKDKVDLRGFNYYNESIQARMQEFNEAYLNHVNPFTKLAYKADPAVIGLLLTNENDVTFHFGNLFLPGKGHPEHAAIFTNDYKQFAKATGLSESKVWRAWEPGESKIYLSDVEHRFNRKFINHIRKLDAKAMIATTQSWGGVMGLSSLPSLTDGDIIDTHSYSRVEEFNFNPRFNPSYLAWIAAAQVAGKPLSVSEWNVEPFPAADRFTAPIYTASIAALQGWDAMMLYGYSQHPLGGKIQGNNYSTFTDPAITGMMPASALIYRQGHVSPAKKNYELQLNENDFFYKKQDPSTSKTIRTLLESSRLSVKIPSVPALPWLSENNKVQSVGNVLPINDTNADFIPAGQEFVLSDTGELKRDWAKGIHTVNAAKSQVASGWLGGQAVTLQDVVFNIDTKKVTVAVQSLDNKPLKQSKAIFITAMARSMPEKTSFLSEPVIGEIHIAAPAGLKLSAVDSVGKQANPVKVDYAKGKYHIKLNGKNAMHWLVLKAH